MVKGRGANYDHIANPTCWQRSFFKKQALQTINAKLDNCLIKIHTRAKITLNVRAMLISKLNDFNYHVGWAYDKGVWDLNAMQKSKGAN